MPANALMGLAVTSHDILQLNISTFDQVALTSLVARGATTDWAPPLVARDIKYLILAREVDWRAYRYLEYQPDLVEVGDYGSLVLYRNLLWR